MASSSSPEEITLYVQGMDCASCARSLETSVARIAGVDSCTLHFTTEKMQVVGHVTYEQIADHIRALGYEVAETQAPPSATENIASRSLLPFLWQRRDTRQALIGLLLIIPGIIGHELLHISHPLLALTSLLALGIAGTPIARSAWRTLRMNRQISINLLMTIASIGAVFIGAFTEAGMVMVLFALGEALEGYTSARARESIRSLVAVVPDEATLLRRATIQKCTGETCAPQEPCGCQENETMQTTCDNGSDACAQEPCGCHEEHEQTTCTGTHVPDSQLAAQRVHVASLHVGDVILARPGERIPMDGRVIAGESAVNQAPITGESRLIEKGKGAEVFASSINGEGSLEIEVTQRVEDNTISRLIKMVEEAQEKRAPVQRFVDRFAQYYTPAVITIALLVALLPPLMFGQPFWNPAPDEYGWLYRALALLVVACPCALVISTPVSIISAISNGARNGLLVKGGAYLEALSRVKAIAFDKTGTLTEGKPTVIMARSVQCNLPHQATAQPSLAELDWCSNCDDMLALASAVEQQSEHPLATAIVHESVRRGVHTRYPAAQMVRALTGRGVTGTIEGHQITLGSHKSIETTIAHPAVHCAEANQDAAQGYTPIMVTRDNTYLGKITVSDTVRSSSQQALVMLKSQGFKALVMLTGDNAQAAQRVGETVGVTEVQAELLPEAKVAAVEELRKQHGSVAMVGDGINDAPALATADVGIAIGAAYGGTAQAMETADISLMSDDLRQLPFAFGLSRATMRTIHTNVLLSLGIKAGFLVLVLFGMGTMWMAVLADMGTSLLVTLNGMRLLRWKH